jgi:hypothetical protein
MGHRFSRRYGQGNFPSVGIPELEGMAAHVQQITKLTCSATRLSKSSR